MLQNCRIQEPPNLCYPVSDKIINIPVLFCNTAIMTIFMCLQKVYSNTTEDIAILPYSKLPGHRTVKYSRMI